MHESCNCSTCMVFLLLFSIFLSLHNSFSSFTILLLLLSRFFFFVRLFFLSIQVVLFYFKFVSWMFESLLVLKQRNKLNQHQWKHLFCIHSQHSPSLLSNLKPRNSLEFMARHKLVPCTNLLLGISERYLCVSLDWVFNISQLILFIF